MFPFCGAFCSGEQAKNEVIFETIIPKGVYQPAERKVFRSLDEIEDGVKVEKIVKSEYQRLSLQHSLSASKYTDKQFPPNSKSLGNFLPLQGRKVEWRRVGEVIANPKLLEYVTPHQIAQTNFGDCYFVSTIGALAENQSRIKFLFGSLDINSAGLYMVRVNIKGVQKEILVDDYFPVYAHNSQFVYAKPIEDEDIWLMLLEKVWAKINGSYSSIFAGYPHEVLTTFSNAPSFYVKLDHIEDKNSVWECVKEAKREGYPICCSSKDQVNTKSGIMKLATYSLADCFEVPLNGSTHRILAIRNPWEQNEYKGQYSQHDHGFWDNFGNTQISLNLINKDSTFLIGLDDFFRHFESLDILHVHSYYNYNFEELTTSPKRGCYFRVELKEPTECYFVLQQERRGKNSADNKMYFSRMTLAVGRWSDENEHYEYVDSKLENYLPTLPARCLVLEPGNYMVYCKCEWMDGLPNSLTFATYSSKKVSIVRCEKDRRLIPEIMIDHAYKRGRRTMLDDKSWVSLELLYNEGGCAYIFADVEEGSSKKILLEWSREQLQKCGLRVKYPKGNNRLVAKSNQSQIIVCRVILNTKQIVFPPPVKISQSL